MVTRFKKDDGSQSQRKPRKSRKDYTGKKDKLSGREGFLMIAGLLAGMLISPSIGEMINPSRKTRKNGKPEANKKR